MKSIHSQADAMGWAVPFAAQHPPELPLRLSNLRLSTRTWPCPGRTARSSEALHVVSMEACPAPPSLPSFLPSLLTYRFQMLSATSSSYHRGFTYLHPVCCIFITKMCIVCPLLLSQRTLQLHFSSCTIFSLFFLSQSFKVLRDTMLHGLRPLSSWLRPGFTWGQPSGAL